MTRKALSFEDPGSSLIGSANPEASEKSPNRVLTPSSFVRPSAGRWALAPCCHTSTDL